MMIFRALLAGLLTVALIVTAWVHCCVSLGFDAALLRTANDQQAPIKHSQHDEHNDEGDCGESEARACDVMVQAGAPQVPAAVPSLASQPASLSIVASDSLAPVLTASGKADPPPVRAQRFKDFYTKTGRLLV